MNTLIIFDFNKDSDTQNWNIVDDIVMGGVSSSKFSISSDGNGVFEGKVSLENNGGFSSVQYRFKSINTDNYSKFVIRIKGDGKKYQFRIRSKFDDYFAYVAHFKTTTEWQTIEIPFNEMYPSFRGSKLDKENFSGGNIQQIGFLISNKIEEAFKLEIDRIEIM